MCGNVCEQASEPGEHVIIILSVPVVHVHAYAACLHGHRGSDDVFKVARQLRDGVLGEC